MSSRVSLRSSLKSLKMLRESGRTKAEVAVARVRVKRDLILDDSIDYQLEMKRLREGRQGVQQGQEKICIRQLVYFCQ